MYPFEQYLQEHHLEALAVSINAKVRYMTVYNATKDNPITPEHAQKIRQAVHHMTGVPYAGTLTLTEPKPIEDVPTIPIKKIRRHNLI
jgi:hypothetical protein